MKHIKFAGVCILLCAVLLVCAGCGRQPQIYTATWFDVFDTVTTVMAAADSEDAFQQQADALHRELLHLHRLFDIYHEYDGLSNLKTVNDSAGRAPVAVEPEILELLADCRRDYESTGGLVNAAMGSVLTLWHDARTAAAEDPDGAALPDPELLAEAALHTDFDDVLLDEESGTVFLTDPHLHLDVGAVAKGWAAGRAAASLPEGWLLSLGGNVVATGPKFPDGTPWSVGIQDPDSSGYVATVPLTRGSLVTSGDYQRYFTVDYHHIIDPATRYPARLWRSVTVLCGDSARADALSTALFLLDREAGQQLLDRFGAAALWIAPDGSVLPGADFPVS